jgi:hypothetical protein
MAEVKAQILWERIEMDLVNYRDQYSKIIVKDSLIYLHGGGTWNNSGNFVKTFYSCYNISGKLKWRKNGRNIPYSSGGDLIQDSDSLLLTYRIYSNSLKLGLQKINMRTGDTLPSVLVNLSFPYSSLTNGPMLKDANGAFTLVGDGPVLTRLSNTGVPMWTKSYFRPLPGGSLEWDDLGDFIQLRNGGSLFGGSRRKQFGNSFAGHPILTEFKPNGDTLKTHKFVLENPFYYEEIFNTNLIQTRKGDFIFAGRIDTVFDNCVGCDVKYFVSKADPNFNLKWTYTNKGILKKYFIIRVAELADSSFALLANSYLDQSYAIIKISKNGQYVTHNTYFNSFCNGSPMLFDWKILPDGTVVVAGKCKNHGYSYLARVTGMGIPTVLGENEELNERNKFSMDAFPNPAKATASISYSLPTSVRNADLQIYEIATGKKVKQMKLKIKAKLQEVSVADLNSGMYAYTLVADGVPIITKKLTIVK